MTKGYSLLILNIPILYFILTNRLWEDRPAANNAGDGSKVSMSITVWCPLDPDMKLAIMLWNAV